MTPQDIAQIRRQYAIEAELVIIEQIPTNSFVTVSRPHLLGREILKESVARIRELNH